MRNGNFRSTLKNLLADYDRHIAEAEKKVRTSQKEVERLRELRNAAALLWADETGKTIQISTAENPFTGMSVTDAVAMVFRQRGNDPMHANDITKAVREGGWASKAKNPKLTVVGAIFRDNRFEKLGGNKFRLRPEEKSEAKGISP